MKTRSSVIVATIVFSIVCQCAADDKIIGFENTNITCRDKKDNDSDGHTDCEDQDCQATSACDNGLGSGTSGYRWDSGTNNDDKNSDSGEDAEPYSFYDEDAEISVDNDDGSMEEVCHEQGFPITPNPVTIMLLLDYSSSMAIYPDTPPYRWSQAVAALTTVLSSVSNPYISFGLDLFPDGSDTRSAEGRSAECGVKKPVQIDCANDNETEIINFLIDQPAPPTTGNMTPMWCALDNFNDAAYAPGCNSKDAEPYVVVISDGSDTCGTDCHCIDTPDTCGQPEFGATALDLGSLTTSLYVNSVKTFVISFGSGADVEKLNAIATNGGTVLKSYLDAADEEELLAAFDEILDAIVSCEYTIDEPDKTEADSEVVNFYFDDDKIPRINMEKDCESNNGWQWTNENHTEMRFCNDTCKTLKSGEVKEVKATFGCPTVIK